MTQRNWGSLLLLVALLLTAGCNSTSEAPAPPRQAQVSDYHRLGYGLRWTTDLDVPKDQTLEHVEVLDDLIVTLETPSNILTAVNAADGQLLWRRVVTSSAEKLFTPFRTNSTAEIDDAGRPTPLSKMVIINTENKVYYFSALDGHFINAHVLPAAAANAPAVAENLALFGSFSGLIYGFDLSTGFKKWAYQLPAAIVSRPVLVKPSVFVADVGGNYALVVGRAYSAEDKPGELRWRGHAFARVQAMAAVNNQGIYVASEDQSLYSLNRATGRDRWIYRTSEPLYLGPITMGSSLYLPLATGSLVSLDPATGNELWRFPSLAKPVMLQDQRLLASAGNQIWILDNQTGKPILEVSVDPMRAVLRGDKNSLILITPTGRIQRLDPEQ